MQGITDLACLPGQPVSFILFTRLLPDYLDDESYRELQLVLLENPSMGDLIPGSGGFRKFKVAESKKRKGKKRRAAGNLLPPGCGSSNMVFHDI